MPFSTELVFGPWAVGMYSEAPTVNYRTILPDGGGEEPDFTISSTTVIGEWGPVIVGQLIPNSSSPPGVIFELVGETSGFAVISGGAE